MEYNLQLTADNQFNLELESLQEFNIELERPTFTIESVTNLVEGEWGKITGNILDQSDLQVVLNGIDTRLDTLESKPSDVLPFTNYNYFPNIGNEGVLYLDETSNISYRWDSDNVKYYKISDIEEIKEINGGTA